MSTAEGITPRLPDRTAFAPEDAIRIVRRVGLGLLVASLFVEWTGHSFVRWRRWIARLEYRLLPDAPDRGAPLADLAVEILNATSPR
jgi:hypothetical protein